MLDNAAQADIHRVELIKLATEAREAAYAPYSSFRVGAAVLTASGRVFTGCNVENVSFGLSNCAESSAAFSAIAAGEREIVAIAVVARDLVFPCGACLQVIREFAGEQPPVIIAANTAGDYIEKSLAECLPFGFSGFTPEG
jgi:cytidine deaminase